MMHQYIVLSVVLVMLYSGGLGAQERALKGKVVRHGEHTEEIPEVNVTVRIEGGGSSHTTNSYGEFRLFLAPIFKAGEKVTLVVDKPGWCVQYPLEGEARIPADLDKELVKVRLLPVGSKLFWTHDRIEKFIQDMAAKARQQMTLEGKPEQIDFGRYIKDWAVKYGFSVQHAKAEIDAWIADVEKNQHDLYTLGLAAFARQNFVEASKLFTDSAEYKAHKLAALKQQEQTLREEVARDFRLAGQAQAKDKKPAEAIQAYQRALQYVTQEQTPQEWAAIWRDIGWANLQLAQNRRKGRPCTARSAQQSGRFDMP
jgi:hypothetical protein